jgi:hypothetical protein
MRAKPLLLTAAILATALIPAAAVKAQDNDLVEVQENDLILTVDDSIRNAAFTFAPSSFDISEGQPSGEPPVVASFTRSNDRLNFRVYAGRRRTGSVADTFNERTTERVATRREKASGGPSELNFTFNGTLTLNGDQFPNFNIGQGSKGGGLSDSNNNWWVGVASGGQTAVKSGDAFLCITGPTGTIYQITLPGDDSSRLRVRALGEGEVCGT